MSIPASSIYKMAPAASEERFVAKKDHHGISVEVYENYFDVFGIRLRIEDREFEVLFGKNRTTLEKIAQELRADIQKAILWHQQ